MVMIKGSALALIGIVLVSCLAYNDVIGSEPRMSVSLDWSNASFIGEKANDQAGYSISSAGDVNGDGYDDFLIGAKFNDEAGDSAGQVYLVLGKATGWSKNTGLSGVSASFHGEDAGDSCGGSVAGVGDVNGDGYDDILIGAYQDDDGGSDAGQAYLILGKSSGWAMDTDLSSSSASFWGENAGDQAGYWVSGAGDVNGDGYDDMLIGASSNDDGGTNAGQVYLVLGKSSGWSMDTDLSSSSASFLGENANDYIEKSAGAGDVNGDGYDDILIGTYNNDEAGTNAGQVYLVLGKSSGWAMDTSLTTASASYWGENIGDQLGMSVSGAGDVNGDGFDDILMGANRNDGAGVDSGQIYLVFGKRSGWARDTSAASASASFLGEVPGDYAGISVSGAGDVDNDGYDDIVIGANMNSLRDDGAGQSYLILGKSSGWAMDTDLSTSFASFVGEDDDDQTGRNVAGAGDVNGDGFDDLLLASKQDSEGGDFAGQVYLVLSFTDPPSPRSLRASLSTDQARVSLSWTAPLAWAEPLVCYRIYRSADGGDLEYMGWTTTSTRTFSDSAVTIGTNYRYMVVTDYDKGENYQGKAFVSILCDLDTDGDGIGNMADWDDDNDGFADQSDAFPLDKTEWLDTDLDGEGNEADKDDDNDGLPDGDDAEPLNPLNYLQLDLEDMRQDLLGASGEIALILEGLGRDLEDVNDTVLGRIDELDNDISVHLYLLERQMEAVNASIRTRSDELNSALEAFRAEMETGLDEITTTMDSDQADILGEIEALQDLLMDLAVDLEGTNESILGSLDEGLAGLSMRLGTESGNVSGLIEGLRGRIAEYDQGTRESIQNVSDLMARMNELETLSDTADRIETDLDKLNSLQTGVGDIRDEQERTSSGLSTNTLLMIITIVLLVIAIVLLLVSLIRGGRRGSVPME